MNLPAKRLPRQLTPPERRKFQHNIARLMGQAKTNPAAAVKNVADVALEWRDRAVAAQRAQNPNGGGGSRFWLGVTSTATAMGFAAVDATQEAKRAYEVEKWKTEIGPAKGVDTSESGHPEPFERIVDANGTVVHEGTTDPRTWFGVQKTAYAAAGLAIAGGLTLWAAEKPATIYERERRRTTATIGRILSAGAVGGVCYIAGQQVRDSMYASKLKQLRDAEIAAESKAVVAQNPRHRRYPRAA